MKQHQFKHSAAIDELTVLIDNSKKAVLPSQVFSFYGELDRFFEKIYQRGYNKGYEVGFAESVDFIDEINEKKRCF